MSSYLDLQVLYGTNVGECDDVRGGEPRGKILPDAAAGRGRVGGGAATEALLTVFSRNHNHLAEAIAAECGDADDESVFQMACLLYTSPSPRDATLSRMPSSA